MVLEGTTYSAMDGPGGQLLEGTAFMAVASSPAGVVLAGPVFMVIFGTAHTQIMSNE